MTAEVNEPKFNDVSVEHPTIKDYIRNMTKQGRTKEEIMKVVGMPYEVVDREYQKAKEKS